MMLDNENFEQDRQNKLKKLRQVIEDGINSGPSTTWDVKEVKDRERALYENYQKRHLKPNNGPNY